MKWKRCDESLPVMGRWVFGFNRDDFMAYIVRRVDMRTTGWRWKDDKGFVRIVDWWLDGEFPERPTWLGKRAKV